MSTRARHDLCYGRHEYHDDRSTAQTVAWMNIQGVARRHPSVTGRRLTSALFIPDPLHSFVIVSQNLDHLWSSHTHTIIHPRLFLSFSLSLASTAVISSPTIRLSSDWHFCGTIDAHRYDPHHSPVAHPTTTTASRAQIPPSTALLPPAEAFVAPGMPAMVVDRAAPSVPFAFLLFPMYAPVVRPVAFLQLGGDARSILNVISAHCAPTDPTFD